MFIIHDPYNKTCLIAHNEIRNIDGDQINALRATRWGSSINMIKQFETKELAQKELKVIRACWIDEFSDREAIQSVTRLIILEVKVCPSIPTAEEMDLKSIQSECNSRDGQYV